MCERPSPRQDPLIDTAMKGKGLEGSVPLRWSGLTMYGF